MPVFDGTNLIMVMDSPINGVLTVNVQQDWYKSWKQWLLSNPNNRGYPALFKDSFGGNLLTSGIDAGAYFVFQNQKGWRIRSTEGNQTVYLVGNLIVADSTLPIMIPTIGTFTVLLLGLQPITQNVDTILTSQNNNVTNLQYMIESQVPQLASFGGIHYVDPVNGLDTNDGSTPTTAYKTIMAAHTSVIDNNGDIIFIVAKNTASVVINEVLTITKNKLSLRSSDFGIIIQPTVSGNNTLSVTGDNFTMSNITVKTALGGNDDAITFTGSDNSSLNNIRIESAAGRGLVTVNSNKLEINKTFIGYSGSHGVEITDCIDMLIIDSHIDTNSGDNVKINSTAFGNTHEVIFRRTIIHEAGGWGVNIGVDCETIQFLDRCKFILNTTGNINDLGTTTFNENSSINVEMGARSIEGNYTHDEVMRVISSALAGLLSGADTGTPVFKAMGGAKNRISATTDENGNRSAIILDLTP